MTGLPVSPRRERPAIQMLRFVPALLVSAAVVLLAPFMGQLRAALQAALPEHFVPVVGSSVAAALAAAVLAAVARIRERRRLRYGAVAAALVLGFAYAIVQSTGNPEIDAVERVHFLQYGLIAVLFYAAWQPRGDASMFVLPVLAGTIVGTLEEWLQWFVPVRVGEVRDVALNLVAVGCGLLFGVGLSPPRLFERRLRRGSFVRVGLLASGALLVLAAFVHAVHLGFVVPLDDVGTFRSRYRAEELRALAAERAARWRQDPPLTFTRLSREDQYLDEGHWHVRRRNELWTNGDHAGAWYENRILEEFFAPILETPSYVSATGHRWPAEQRAEAERAPITGEGAYVSRAEPLPILTWSRTFFWLVVLGLATALAGLGWLGDRRRLG